METFAKTFSQRIPGSVRILMPAPPNLDGQGLPSSVNQDRIICGLFEQIISNNPQITSALFAIICGLFVDDLRLLVGLLVALFEIICQIICRLFEIICWIIFWLFADYLSLFVDYLSVIQD